VNTGGPGSQKLPSRLHFFLIKVFLIKVVQTPISIYNFCAEVAKFNLGFLAL